MGPMGRWSDMKRALAVVALGAAVLGLTLALQPNLILGLRSPRALAFAVGTAVACAVLSRVARRLGARPSVALAVAALPAVAVLGLVVIRPILDVKELDEALPPGPPPASAPVAGGPQAPAAPARVASGELRGLDGHAAKGQISTFRNADGTHLIRFESVDIGGTPDPKVYLLTGRDRTGKRGGVLIGDLKAARGSFNYALPDSFVGKDFTVLVWCGQFAVNVAHATQVNST